MAVPAIAPTADAAARKFKKKLGPKHIHPDHVLPANSYGMTGITLRPIRNKPGLHLISAALA